MEESLIRQLQEDLLETLNKSPVNLEVKRLLLALLAKDCELKANIIMQGNQTVTEEGELENGTELDKGAR